MLHRLFHLSGRTLLLTPLYRWYAGDFEQVSGHVLDYIAGQIEALEIGDRPTIRWLDYDWRLNSRSNRRAR